MSAHPNSVSLGRDAVLAAARALQGRVWRTPVLRCPALDELAGAEVWMKAENLQRIGAFKARGAMYAVSQLADHERQRGIITYSSGNHAQAVALAARTFGVPATIAMPIDAPAVKVAGVKQLGAEVVPAGTTSDDRRRVAQEIAARTGGLIVEPFDHEHVIAGQGTATLELLEDVATQTSEELDVLLVPVGGGGLIAGACLACEGTTTAVYSVEPEGCDAMAQSLEAGERVTVTPGPTIADGLKPVSIGVLNFAIAQSRIQGAFRVEDGDIGRALVRLLMRAKVLVEPSGAAALAVALAGRVPGNPRRIGVILSGGNVGHERINTLLADYGADA